MLQIIVANPEAYAFDDGTIRYAEELKKYDLVSIRHRPDYYRFRVESTGALDAYLIVSHAIDVLINKTNAATAQQQSMRARGDDDQAGD
jgi:RNA polymerase Rpb3/Rpb11 dimerisation domain